LPPPIKQYRTTTISWQTPGQAFRVTFSVRVKLPPAPAFTVTEEPIFDPGIDPFPVIDQRYVTVPPLGLTEAV